jgi:hypothetical protein
MENHKDHGFGLIDVKCTRCGVEKRIENVLEGLFGPEIAAQADPWLCDACYAADRRNSNVAE